MISPVVGSANLGVAGLDGSTLAGWPPCPVRPGGNCWRPGPEGNPPRCCWRPSGLPREKSGRPVAGPVPGRPGGSLTAPGLSPGREVGRLGNWIKPILSPTCGPVGTGGGGEATGDCGSALAITASPFSAGTSVAGTAGFSVATIGSTGAGSGAGGGGGGGAVTRIIFSGSAGGAGAAVAAGFPPVNFSSRYSAVILSSELEGTLAAVMPSSLALARTSLFSRPSFFEMS